MELQFGIGTLIQKLPAVRPTLPVGKLNFHGRMAIYGLNPCPWLGNPRAQGGKREGASVGFQVEIRYKLSVLLQIVDDHRLELFRRRR